MSERASSTVLDHTFAALPFSLTLFASAALSFAIEPMAAKALLPSLGGVSSVWTTCLLFFQLALLAGYFAQLGLARLRHEGARLAVHATLLMTPLVVSRFDLVERASSASAQSPVLSSLLYLSSTVGAPFVALSTVTPALQRYFTKTYRASPYALYASSNAGSIAGLLAYPLLIEPLTSLAQQSRGLIVGYSLVALAALALGARALGARPSAAPSSTDRGDESSERDPLARWVALAAAPSALLATTSATLASDLPGVPLLWVAPLTTYLLTFVLAFRRAKPAPAWVARALPIVALVLVPLSARRLTSPFALVLVMHLGCLALTSYAAHARLASSAPRAARLERFYLSIAVGGVLGTLLFGILPPLLLSDLWEPPLCVALACIVRIEHSKDSPSSTLDRWLLAAPALWLLGVTAALRALSRNVDAVMVALAYVPAILLCAKSSERPRSFALSLSLVALAACVFESSSSHTLTRARSYFGALRVERADAGRFHMLIHGTTIHGVERRSDRDRCVPRSYYSREGPLGRAFESRRAALDTRSILAVGLGAGSTVCFARPDERWTFVEIDPEVLRIARDPRWFTFLSSNPLGREPELVVGDGRLVIAREPPRSRSMIIIDAFNSDSVPLHLLTREALALALRALEPQGWLLIHGSNRALVLSRALSALVQAAGVHARVNTDAVEFSGQGSTPTWVVIARDERDLASLRDRWMRLPDPRGLAPFTDGHASIVPVIRW